VSAVEYASGLQAHDGADEPYVARRDAIAHYFDRTAIEAWARLTSDAPVSGIREKVRAGREAMRATLLSWLPQDLSGTRVLDAGCGPATMSAELARRGATVVGVDLSPQLIQLGRDRLGPELASRVTLIAGDMLDEALGRFDHVVSMDALIHYPAAEAAAMLGRLAPRVSGTLLFTFAPKTPLLALMHAAGRLFPRADRAPAIQPVSAAEIAHRTAAEPALAEWRAGRTQRVNGGVYTCQAMELVRSRRDRTASFETPFQGSSE
jgi:magnesium-protoporphyrin O-methyltransferase